MDKEDGFMHTREFHPPSRILPFVTAWRSLEGIMLAETSQMQEGKHGTRFIYVGPRTWERTEAGVRRWLRGPRGGKRADGGQGIRVSVVRGE